MTDQDPRHARFAELRRALQPVPLSPAQRRRHRELLAHNLEGDDMEWLRQRGRMELAIVALMLAVLAGGFIVWNSVLNDPTDGSESGGLLAAAEATLTAGAGQPLPTPTPDATEVQAAESAGADECAIDGYAQDLPAGRPQFNDAFEDWYGSREGGLWVSPANRAIYRPGLDYIQNRWFAGDATPMFWYGSDDPVTISARQLDGDATAEAGEVISLSANSRAQWATIDIPTPGCWEISGQAADKSLSITVVVSPFEQRPDIVFLRELEALRPYEIPDTCPATPFSEPVAQADSIIATHWLEDDGLGIDMDQAWLVANREEPVHLIHDSGSGAITIRAVSHDDAALSFEAPANPMATDGTASFSDLTFPRPGCWGIEIETAVRTAEFTVYVYPSDCAPIIETLQIPATCRQPEE
jgi:hypothetical protein